ncbi:MAG TPA: amidohydrolase family protein [Bryobacteraceae bacterium]|nr:amidohydrolase family protein [Bryobacteraceae bacterium]
MRRREFTVTLAGAAMAASKYRIVDSHVHVWKKDPRYPWAKETKAPPDKDASAEMLLELMKKNGVERTVIIQVIHYRWDNSYLADVLKQYPKTFHGVARVNPEDPAAPDHLSKLVKEQRFRGVRISPAGNASGDWFRGPLMPPLWKRCDDLKVPMTLLAPVTRMPDAAALIEKYPGLTVVIDHMADSPLDKPEELEKLIALKRYPKVFVKISHTWSLSKQEYPWRDSQEQVKRLHAAFGPKRLMWGTDWPVSERHATYAQTLSVVRDEMKFLNDEDKSWMLSKTVERVWPFPS